LATGSVAVFAAIGGLGGFGGAAIGGISVFCRHHGQRTTVPARLW